MAGFNPLAKLTKLVEGLVSDFATFKTELQDLKTNVAEMGKSMSSGFGSVIYLLNKNTELLNKNTELLNKNTELCQHIIQRLNHLETKFDALEEKVDFLTNEVSRYTNESDQLMLSAFAFLKQKGIAFNTGDTARLGSIVSGLSYCEGYRAEKMKDPRYGGVYIYEQEALEAAYDMFKLGLDRYCV